MLKRLLSQSSVNSCSRCYVTMKIYCQVRVLFLCTCALAATSLLISIMHTLQDFQVKNPMANVFIHAGETERLKRMTDALPWLSHPLLPRVITRHERDRCIELLLTVGAILREFNITYTLAYGTLLGSYVMHDMLPWDDDLDIFVNIDELPKIRRLFNASGAGHYKQLQLVECKASKKTAFTLKLYSLADPKAGQYKWHWPYVDIAFYHKRNSVLASYKNRPYWQMNQHNFFPLVQRPLGGHLFPAPRNTRAFIAYRYRRFVCRSHKWDHKNEVFIRRSRRHSANCKSLASHYPFVKRNVLYGKTLETLVLNGKVIYTFIIELEQSTSSIHYQYRTRWTGKKKVEQWNIV